MISYWGVDHGDVISKSLLDGVKSDYHSIRSRQLERKALNQWDKGKREAGYKSKDKSWGHYYKAEDAALRYAAKKDRPAVFTPFKQRKVNQ